MKTNLAIIFLTFFILVACNSSSDSPTNVLKDVRVYNSMTDKNDYEVTLNDRSLDGSGTFFRTNAGASSVYLKVTRKSDNVIVFEKLYDVGSATSETLIDYSLVISGDFNDLKVLLIDDNQITTLSTGKAQIKLANLSTNKGAVDIYVVSNLSDCAPLNGALTPTANLAVGESTGFIIVDENATGVCYFPEGTNSPSVLTTVSYGSEKTLTGIVVNNGTGDELISYNPQ